METPRGTEPRLGVQFSLLSLLTLTAVSAGALALVRTLNLPPSVQLIFAGYAILMAAYILLRGVALCRRSFQLRRQVAGRRRELEAWVEDQASGKKE